MTDLNINGMAIASTVVDTIVSIAAKDVEGIASVGSPASATDGIMQALGAKPASSGIEVDVGDDEKLHVAIRVEVYYGYVLPEVAAKLRTAIADAVSSQVGVEVGSVDVYIDGIQFAG